MLVQRNLGGVKAIIWGINHEDVALQAYTNLGGEVHPSSMLSSVFHCITIEFVIIIYKVIVSLKNTFLNHK